MSSRFATRACAPSSSASRTPTGAVTSSSSRQVRDAVGPRMELMVDANHGWRMAGDRAPRWDVATAAAVRARARAARRLLARGAAPHRRRRRLRAAAPANDAAHRRRRDGAPPVRGARPDPARRRRRHPARRRARRGNRRLPPHRRAGRLCGRAFSPHTWTNGYGLLANLHLALAVSTCPFLEVPFDPPAWTPERRDWILPAPLEIAPDGTIAPPRAPASASRPTSTRSRRSGSGDQRSARQSSAGRGDRALGSRR